MAPLAKEEMHLILEAHKIPRQVYDVWVQAAEGLPGVICARSSALGLLGANQLDAMLQTSESWSALFPGVCQSLERSLAGLTESARTAWLGLCSLEGTYDTTTAMHLLDAGVMGLLTIESLCTAHLFASCGTGADVEEREGRLGWAQASDACLSRQRVPRCAGRRCLGLDLREDA